MARAIWSGSISFGLVNVPVKLYSAVRQKDVRFHQLDAKSGARVRYKRVSEKSGREVDYDDIVKGYELGGDKYVTITPEELEAMAPENTRTIEVEGFVDLDAIDPIHFEKTYWLASAGGKGGAKAYRLLVDSLTKANRVAVARFVMREKQYLAALRAIGKSLALHTMTFPDEIVDRTEIDGTEVKDKVSEREVKMALQLIDSLTVDWEPDRYHDTYREDVLELIDRKAKGEEIVEAPAREERADVVDLMSALEASLARGKGKGAKGKARAGGDGKRVDDLDGLTKSELNEMAAELDVNGRSKMSKDELVKAIRRAEARGARKSA